MQCNRIERVPLLVTQEAQNTAGGRVSLKAEIVDLPSGYTVIDHGFMADTSNTNPTIQNLLKPLGATETANTFQDTTIIGANQNLYYRAYMVVSINNNNDTILGNVKVYQNNQPPTIRDFTPKTSYIDSLIVLQGINFSSIASENIVTFNGVQAEVLKASIVSLLVRIPMDATSGRIKIQIKDKETTSSEDISILRDFWTDLPPLPDTARTEAMSFTIGRKAYVVGGSIPFIGLFRGTWEYDGDLNKWTRKADLKGQNRQLSVAFALNGLGYIGIGEGAFGIRFEDIFRYNPITNIWTRLGDFAVGNVKSRSGATSFVVNNKAYMIGGIYDDGGRKVSDSVFVYNTSSDQWSFATKYPSGGRSAMIAFVIDNKVYVGSGNSAPFGGAPNADFWEYTPNTNTWVRKADIPSARTDATAFVIGNKGYVVGGTGNASTLLNDLWQYTPQTNTWVRKANLLRDKPRTEMVGFSIGNRGYIATGQTTDSSTTKILHRYMP
ncbi:MAG: IPT/TIG domain-containing protein [Raineya sp.]|jgi:N-acetylneuraminic acid mutarotase|nr:IPT/TIG domain-containing protein [Raineya sp.]